MYLDIRIGSSDDENKNDIRQNLCTGIKKSIKNYDESIRAAEVDLDNTIISKGLHHAMAFGSAEKNDSVLLYLTLIIPIQWPQTAFVHDIAVLIIRTSKHFWLHQCI